MSTLNTSPELRTHGSPIKATRKERIMESIANYSAETQKRIQAALARAQASTRRAHLLGKNAKHGYTVYQVYSSKPRPTPYTLRVYQYPVLNAFRYLPTLHYIQCECHAAQNGCPCHHAAIVARRLHREAGGTQAQETAGAGSEPARRKLTLEELFQDVA